MSSLCVYLAVIPSYFRLLLTSVPIRTSPWGACLWPQDLAAWTPLWSVLEQYMLVFISCRKDGLAGLPIWGRHWGRGGWQWEMTFCNPSWYQRECRSERPTTRIIWSRCTGELRHRAHCTPSCPGLSPVATGLSWSVSRGCAVLGGWVESQIKGHFEFQAEHTLVHYVTVPADFCI